MRKARRIGKSVLFLAMDKEDPFVGELARRIMAAWARMGKTGSRSMFRREIADLLADPSFALAAARGPVRPGFARAGGPPPPEISALESIGSRPV